MKQARSAGGWRLLPLGLLLAALAPAAVDLPEGYPKEPAQAEDDQGGDADADAAESSQFHSLEAIADALMLPDGVSLVLAVPVDRELITLDTGVGEGAEISRRLKLDYAPGALAVQGGRLFVAELGPSVIHILSVAEGQELGRIELEGEPIQRLACHPVSGPLFASRGHRQSVTAIDPETQRVGPTKRLAGLAGTWLAVDPTGAPRVFTLTSEVTPSVLLRCDVEDLTLTVAQQDRVGAFGMGVALSNDGKLVSTICRDGYYKGRRGPDIPVLDASELGRMVGGIGVGAGPLAVAYHPHLKLVAVFGGARKLGLKVWHYETNRGRAEPQVRRVAGPGSQLVFGGQGRKLILVGRSTRRSFVQIDPLPLTAEEETALGRIYPTKE